MEVGACRQLQSLNASNNSLASLPSALLSCQLTTLHAANNKMTCHFLAEDFSSLAVSRWVGGVVGARKLVQTLCAPSRCQCPAPAHTIPHHSTPSHTIPHHPTPPHATSRHLAHPHATVQVRGSPLASSLKDLDLRRNTLDAVPAWVFELSESLHSLALGGRALGLAQVSGWGVYCCDFLRLLITSGVS